MLRVKDLRAGYGTAPVLQGIELAIEKGETVALLGPNGAGKSTLMAALTGTVPKREGSVDFEGRGLRKSHEIVAQEEKP
jgi:branched-chain amino acid transport system ATP-binding protein